MKLLYCGFNGFRQLPHITGNVVIELTEFPELSAHDVQVSWSYVVILSDAGIHVSGFRNGRANQLYQVPSLEKTALVSCCERHVLTVDTSGEIRRYCTNTGTLTPVPGFEEENIISVSCGETFDAFATSAGCVSAAMSPILHIPADSVKEVVCGNEHCIILTCSGAVFSWGIGSRGQLGHGDLEKEEEEARQVEMLAGLRVTQVAAGGWHSVAVTDTGDIYVWGWNCDGQLGLPSVGSKVVSDAKKQKLEEVSVQSVPTLLDSLSNVKQVACGSRHTVVLTDDGALLGCGWNMYGQLAASPQYLKKTWQMTQLHVPTPARACGVRCGAWTTVVLCDVP